MLISADSNFGEKTARQGEFIYLISFNKSNILIHCAILPLVIINSIQCLVERSNAPRPNV